jgi:2-keto-3-deoxy-L-rhamnonate aldolase RhmA
VPGNEVKARLAAGGRAIGLMCFEFLTTGVVRVAAASGAEFVLLDMEHSGYGVDAMRGVLAAARPCPIPTLVRPPGSTRAAISGVLDLGAAGVMLPMVESADQARQICDYARYPPEGSRGVKAYLADEIHADGLPATLAQANRDVLVIAQIETATGVDHVEEIAAVPGIDVLLIGHFDLTTSLGAPGAFGSPPHAAAVKRVMEAAAANGKPVGSLANDVEHAQRLLDEGYRLIVLGDVMVFGQALRRELESLRS